jgi:predicted metalloendopeptidase
LARLQIPTSWSITHEIHTWILPRNAAACALLAFAPLIAYAQDAPTPETHGIVVANMGRSVKPGDDFYQYANGDWIKRTQLPPDLGYIDPHGGNFDDFTNDLIRKRIADVIEGAVKTNAPAGSNTRKIADFYHSYMDEATIEAKGLAPLRPHLDAIASISDQHDLARALGESLRADVDALNGGYFHTSNLFGLWVAPGFNDPEHYTVYLLQGGLEMPDREYYLSGSEKAFWSDVHFESAEDDLIATTSSVSRDSKKPCEVRKWPMSFAEAAEVQKWARTMWRHEPAIGNDE